MTSITYAHGWSGLPTSGGCTGPVTNGEGIWELDRHVTLSRGVTGDPKEVWSQPKCPPSRCVIDFKKMGPLILFLFLSGGVALLVFVALSGGRGGLRTMMRG